MSLKAPGSWRVFFIPPPTVASGGWLGECQSSCRLQVSRVSCASICTAHDSHSARGSRCSRRGLVWHITLAQATTKSFSWFPVFVLWMILISNAQEYEWVYFLKCRTIPFLVSRKQAQSYCSICCAVTLRSRQMAEVCAAGDLSSSSKKSVKNRKWRKGRFVNSMISSAIICSACLRVW